MDALSIIDINLDDFKFCDISLMKSFNLSQVCTICFKIKTAFPLNLIVFQNQKVQDILQNITSCFNFETDVEQPILSCHTCLQQLLTSYLFQTKVKQAHNLFKAIVNTSAKKPNKQNKGVKVEVIVGTDLSESEAEPSETDNGNDISDDSDTLNDEAIVKTENEINEIEEEKEESDSGDVMIAEITKREKPGTKLNKTCQICSKVFNKLYKYKYHIAHAHSHPRYKCEVCLKPFCWPENLKRHRFIHLEEKPFTCSTCGRGFIRRSQLKDHERQHSGGKLTCEVCGKICNTKSGFDRHMKIMHTEGDGLTIEERIKKDTARQRKYLNKLKLKPVMCEVCGKTLSGKSALNTHMQSHGEKRFSCDHCDRKFTMKALLVTHTRVHTGERPFACEECGKTFRTASTFNIHKLVHTGEKPFACNLCDMRFRQRPHLQYHMRLHTGIKAYTCKYCNKSFSINGNLTQHLRTHTGDKPFTCEICGKAFAATNNLKKHKATHQAQVPKIEIVEGEWSS